MKSKGKRALKLGFLLIIALALSLRAQIFFGITPIRVELKASPGSQITDIFQVRNNSSQPVRIKVYVENWQMRTDGTPLFIGQQPTSYSCREWIKVNPTDFRLRPGEIRTVRFTVYVPLEAEPAGYHAAVSFENVTETEPELKQSRVGFIGKIAAAVYVVVGKVEPQGSIVDIIFETSNNSQFIKLIINNQGKTHFRLKGEIELRASDGKKINTFQIPDEPVLPESERFVLIQLKEKLSAGNYKAEVKLDIGREELLVMEKNIIVK
ncbi:MAG: hypothetical protein N3B16_05460 [Candidatus Aminicenantes bacterium]|nr:hypothetical protein [Candidatus Aminicenantes bacterium]